MPIASRSKQTLPPCDHCRDHEKRKKPQSVRCINNGLTSIKIRQSAYVLMKH